jgi:hypothetical protein
LTHKHYFSALRHILPENLLKIAKIICAENQPVTKKMHFYVHFFAKIFGHIKKKQYLCTRFWETSVFRFSTGVRTLKFRISFEVLIFLRQTERKNLWKIDTISVVQELRDVGCCFGLNINCQLSTINYLGSQTILHLINRLFWAIL